MKIIGGQFKGRNFYMPAGIRPTQNLARGALFDLLGQDMGGVIFLDLFAGSGAVGLEAISRGAAKVMFVEKDPKCAAVITENMALLRTGPDKAGALPYELLSTDVFAAVKLLSRQEKRFDIIFIDPPYGLGLAKKALKTLEAYDILQPNYMVVIQHEKEEILPEQQGRFLLFRQKKYGGTVLTIYRE
jgi:16S rRNA (guanine(966)-N(2))-methyltransferase RsmD